MTVFDTIRRRVIPALAFTAVLCGAFPQTASSAETFPAHPVKIIVQTAAGASIDVAARFLAESLGRKWKQQALIFNQPGAGGLIAVKALAASPPDGYSLLLAASSIFVVLPELQKAQADDVHGFVPISFVGEQPMAVAVSADTPAKTLPELLALIRSTKGGLNAAVSTRGGLSHLSAEALKGAANVELNFVHYPGTSQALSDVIAGRVPMVVDSLSALVGPASGGQIRIVAVASPVRLPRMPDIPAVAETIPGFAATAWLALVGPRGTPQELATQIGEDVRTILADPAVISRMEEIGTYARWMPPDALAKYIEAERQKWAPVVRNFGGGN